MSERESRIPAGEKGTADRVEADEGAYWVRLVTRQALDREGKAMSNCVGDGEYDAAVGNETLTDDDAIWSLRCCDGVSIATVEVSVLSETEALLVQARGYRNRLVGRGAAEAVRHLVAAYAAAGLRLRMGATSGLVIAPSGRTYRTDRVPEPVWEEIYAASEAEAEATLEPAPAATPFEVPRTLRIEASFSS